MTEIPKTLGPDGGALYKDVTEEYELGPHELAILETACHELDLVRRLEAEVSQLESLRVKGSQGQWVSAPEVSEYRQHSLAFASLISRLKITDGSENQAPAPRTVGAVAMPMSRSEVARLGGRAKARGKRNA
ncbi:hypothetical protein DMP23_04970 [Amycolatopsis sp. A1MSW2902]|uniref:hypothetical protein n=1 Tax=Amycolatopsis sp. A1MSW2902 TaxID=687413 RepID=UPI00307DCDC2